MPTQPVDPALFRNSHCRRRVWDESEPFGEMAVDGVGAAGAVLAKEGKEAGEGGGEEVGGDLRGAEEGHLSAAGPVGVEGDGEGDDRGAGRMPLQVELE